MNPIQFGHEPAIQTAAHSHSVKLWREENSLVKAAVDFISSGLMAGERVLVIATSSHRAAFMKRLKDSLVDADKTLAQGQLKLFDAEEILAKFMVNNRPDRSTFRRLLGDILRQSDGGPYSGTRAYGEMVNVLWERKNLPAAIHLEQLWNELAETYFFSLLCGYFIDSLDSSVYNGALQNICKTHSQLILEGEEVHYESAVKQALHDTFGASLASLLWSLSNRRIPYPSAKIPEAQKHLFWLKENMPLTCEKVLSQAKRHYQRCLQNEAEI